MDEKELVRRVRNSFKVKKSRAEILSNFQKRGYKLAYAEELIKKAKRPKRIIGIFMISILIFFSLTFSVYSIFSNPQKLELENPLANFVINNDPILEKSLVEVSLENNGIETEANFIQKTTYEEIEITPEFISFLLNEIGIWKLHKNPLTLENPIINFKIGNKEFYSKVGNEIETFVGLSDSSDLDFNVNKNDLIDAILSENPGDIFVESISAGKTTVDIIASEPELFAKGYLKLYNTLNY
jgi:hypothetical protein